MFGRERVLLIIGFCAFSGGALAQQQTSNLPTFVSDQVIVAFSPGAPGQAVAAAHAQAGGSPIRSLDAIGATVVRVTPGRVDQAIAAYENNPDVLYAQPNYLRPLIIPDEGQDPPPPTGLGIDYFSEQYGLNNTGQSFSYDPNTGEPGALAGAPDADIDAPEAWDLDTGAAWVKVAVLDSGVDCLHPDLAGKCIENINFGPSPTLADEVGHGTHVAGTIAAIGNNGIGVAGVSWGATIGAFKVCYEYSDFLYGLTALCDSVAMIDALTYAADNGYHVANMSFGGPETGPGEAAAMIYAYNGGVVLVAAAGNNYTQDLMYPAAYAEVIAVAATDWFDNLASFSSFGANWVSLAAPGSQKFNTMPNALCGLPANDPEGCYTWQSGTSMASPTVAGAAALVWSYQSGATAPSVRAALENNADTVGAMGQNMLAWTQHGRLNLYRALSGGAPPPPGNASPTISSTPVTTATIDASYSYDVNASDPDGDVLAYSLDVSPSGMSISASTGLIQWTPVAGQGGSNPVSVRVADGNGGFATQSYSIQVDGGAANNPPVINSTPVTSATEGQPYSYDVNASDADGDSLTYSLDIAPSGMSIGASTGLIQWTPGAAQVGTHAVMARVEDGLGGVDTQSFTVDVGPAEQPNVAPNIDSTPPPTGTVGQLYSYDVDASDANGDTLTYSLDVATTGMTIDSSSGLIQWTPSAAQAGSSFVVARVVDGNGGFDTQSFWINVAAGNTAPTITSTPGTTATVDQPYGYDVNASDANGDVLVYSLDVAASGMTINSSSGLIQWTPSAAQQGSNFVVARVEDGNGGFDTQSFTVNVTATPPANAAPTIDSTPLTTATAGQLYSYDVNATDTDGDVLTFFLDTAPSGMTINGSTGLVQWLPSAGQIGSHPVAVRVEDGNGGSDTQSFSIDVADTPPPNSAPSINSTPATTATEGQPYSYDADASDGDGDTLTYSLEVAPTGMSIQSSSGLVQWTPGSLQVGSSFVVVRVDDGKGGFDTQSYWIDVAPAQVTVNVHIGDLDGSVASEKSNWSAQVVITLHDASELGAPDGFVVYGNWSGAMSAADSCVISGGSCVVDTGTMAKSDGNQVTFTISNVVGDGVFQSGWSHDPDGDSNGFWITLAR